MVLIYMFFTLYLTYLLFWPQLDANSSFIMFLFIIVTELIAYILQKLNLQELIL